MTLSKIFNWKKNPASVFLFALPLFSLGMLLLFARAFLEIKAHGDWGFLIIDLFGAALLALGLWPVRKPLAAIVAGDDRKSN